MDRRQAAGRAAWPAGATWLALVLAVLCGGCTPPAPAAPASHPARGTPAGPGRPGQLSAAELRRLLLRRADLPGYLPYRSVARYPASASKPACAATLDSLDGAASPGAAFTQARTEFAQSQAGPWLTELLRSYPGDRAAGAFRAATATLAGCGTFAVTWTDPAGNATESVRVLPVPRLGTESWSAAIRTSGDNTPVTETIDLVRAGSTILVLEIAAVVGLPSLARTTAIARRGTARLSGR